MAQRPSSRGVLSFAVTYDLRCPFARNVHEHVLAGLDAGALWDVRFVPFSLHQVHVEEGEPDVWDDPARAPDLLAMEADVAVRDNWPDAFRAVHRGLFAARHDRGEDLRERDVVERVLSDAGVDPEKVFELVAEGAPRATFRAEHEEAAREHGVFGVPTIITDSDAVFVRLMTRPDGDGERAIATVERVVDLAGSWPALNELKHTRIPR